MPRRTRMYFPGLPYHVVQRGNNRSPCFFEKDNYAFYLDLWRKIASRYEVSVHAYCLMTNHIHFLATPHNKAGLSNTMKVVGSRYAQYINRKYQRTGTLWEGRHRSSLVQSNRYLLACMRYIELNPVRAMMVDRPEDYQWSSYRSNAWGEESWLQSHADYLVLGAKETARIDNYRGLFQLELCNRDLDLIRKSTHFSQPIGTDQYKQLVGEKLGVKLGQSSRGRPRKAFPKVVKK